MIIRPIKFETDVESYRRPWERLNGVAAHLWGQNFMDIIVMVVIFGSLFSSAATLL